MNDAESHILWLNNGTPYYSTIEELKQFVWDDVNELTKCPSCDEIISSWCKCFWWNNVIENIYKNTINDITDWAEELIIWKDDILIYHDELKIIKKEIIKSINDDEDPIIRCEAEISLFIKCIDTKIIITYSYDIWPSLNYQLKKNWNILHSHKMLDTIRATKDLKNGYSMFSSNVDKIKKLLNYNFENLWNRALDEIIEKEILMEYKFNTALSFDTNKES